MREKLSFVIPCYGSEMTIEAVIGEINDWMKCHPGYTHEIIAVNDRSPDNVFQVLTCLAKDDQSLKVVELAINSGKHAAVLAGYHYVTGDIIVNLDDDCQCPIDQLGLLLSALDEDTDMVYARYPQKKQSLLKIFGSWGNELMARWLINMPKELQMSNFSVMRPFIARQAMCYTNPYPYLNGLFLQATSRFVNVEMDERKRAAGRSTYTFRKSLSLLLNGFTAFSVKPLRLATVIGMCCAFIGFVSSLVTVTRKLLYPEIVAGYSSIVAILLLIGGLLMIMLGLIGEYIGRIYICVNNSPQFVVRQTINCGEGEVLASPLNPF